MTQMFEVIEFFSFKLINNERYKTVTIVIFDSQLFSTIQFIEIKQINEIYFIKLFQRQIRNGYLTIYY